MEIYILDPLRRRSVVVDRFESLIWTERFSAFGEFELVLHSNRTNRQLFKKGQWLAMSDSFRVMRVETIEDSVDKDGRANVKIAGRSIEIILEDRVARNSTGPLNTLPKWMVTDQPADIMRFLYNRICVLGQAHIGDIIPDVTEGTFMPEDTLVEWPDEVTIEIELKSLYSEMKKIADMYNLGFRFLRHPLTRALYFDVYAGSDRTTSQELLPAVVFAPELDNLQDTRHLMTTANEKNVAYVYSPTKTEVVYPLNVDPDVAGFERRVLVVKVDDLEEGLSEEDISKRLIQRGKEELNKHRIFEAFDGEIQQNSQYVYGRDYNLGDLVELRNADGFTNVMRVSEQIFVSDAEGERSYPTLELALLITPGSWLSWDSNRVWADLTTEEWGTMP